LIPLRALIEHQFGLKCDEATNGLIAVDMYIRNMAKTCCEVRYRVIFTDINMPEMDGITEAQQI
jgi:CheY-like chemotaxis protein